jgi:hypothetical protein
MDAETLLDVLAAIPGVQIVEKGTRRAFGGWPKVEVTLALDPRESTPPEFTVRIAECKPEPLPPNVTIPRDPAPAPLNAERALVALRKVLDLDDVAGRPGTWDDVVAYAAKAKGSARMSNDTVKRRTVQLAEALDARTALGETPSWPALLGVARKLVEQADEAVGTQ